MVSDRHNNFWTPKIRLIELSTYLIEFLDRSLSYAEKSNLSSRDRPEALGSESTTVSWLAGSPVLY